MTDRPVRLGDVIDDYCPRCRLLLNHDIASLVGSEVAKVTCRTCYNTHDYRKGDVPKRKARKNDKKQLMDQVLATLPLPAAVLGGVLGELRLIVMLDEVVDHRLQLIGDRLGDLALDGEDIGQIAIVGLRPEMRVGLRVD